MAPPPTPRLLPHQLVARDDRSSYIKRIDTLAGPGAYVIPSTFKAKEMNPHARQIHKQQYGREFSRQQRQSATAADANPLDVDADGELTREERRDRYLERRERLRELLQQLDTQRQQVEHEESTTLVSPFKPDPLPISSPSLSSTSNYDMFVAGYRQQQQQQQAQRRKSLSSPRQAACMQSPTSPSSSLSPTGVGAIGFAGVAARHQKPATSPATSPALTYRAYLSTTSYRRRAATSTGVARQSLRAPSRS